jgi:hypothetical protein
MAALKKPRKKKYPKRPKSNAAVSVMENYLEKVKAIDKQFESDTAAYNKDVKKRTELKAKIGKVKR